MSDESWRRDGIESPCVSICMIHPDAGLCAGCLRTVDEIARWTAMEPEERSRIMAELPDRAGRLRVRRGGRAGRLKR